MDENKLNKLYDQHKGASLEALDRFIEFVAENEDSFKEHDWDVEKLLGDLRDAYSILRD